MDVSACDGDTSACLCKRFSTVRASWPAPPQFSAPGSATQLSEDVRFASARATGAARMPTSATQVIRGRTPTAVLYHGMETWAHASAVAAPRVEGGSAGGAVSPALAGGFVHVMSRKSRTKIE